MTAIIINMDSYLSGVRSAAGEPLSNLKVISVYRLSARAVNGNIDKKVHIFSSLPWRIYASFSHAARRPFPAPPAPGAVRGRFPPGRQALFRGGPLSNFPVKRGLAGRKSGENVENEKGGLTKVVLSCKVTRNISVEIR